MKDPQPITMALSDDKTLDDSSAREVLNAAGVARLLGIGVEQVRTLTAAAQIPAVTFGNRSRYSRSGVLKWLERRSLTHCETKSLPYTRADGWPRDAESSVTWDELSASDGVALADTERSAPEQGTDESPPTSEPS